MLGSLFNKVTGLKRSATLLKRDSTQVFPCEICKIFKNTYFYGTPPVATSKLAKMFLIFSTFRYDYVAFCLKHVALEIIQILFKWRLKTKHLPVKCFDIYFAKKNKW